MPRLTPNRRAFEREQKRLQRIISTEVKHKQILAVEAYEAIPKMPMIVTKKKLQEIQRITRSDILSKAEVFNPETGEWEQYQIPKSRPRNIAAIQPLKTEREIRKIRKQAAKQAAKTRAYHRSPEYREERREAIRRKARTEYGIYDKYLIEELEEASDKILSREMTEDELLDLLNRKQREQEELDYFQWEVEEELREEEERQRQKELDEYEQSLEDSVREVEEPDDEPFEEPDEEEDTEEYDDFGSPSPEDYDIPQFGQQAIEYIRSQAQYANNKYVAALIVQILDETIEREGYEDVVDRLTSKPEVFMLVDFVYMAQSKDDSYFYNVQALIECITGDSFGYEADVYDAMNRDTENTGYFNSWRY